MATQGERVTALEVSTDEHERRLNGINGQIEGLRQEQQETNRHFAGFREETVRALATLQTKAAIYAALGAAVGGGVVSFVVYLLVARTTGGAGSVAVP